MYTFKENGTVKEFMCGKNFEYIIENERSFASTSYKVLKNQRNDIFIQCMKMMRNGKISLYYMTEDYLPITSMLNKITHDILISIMVNLFANVMDVRKNGFLECQYIDLSWNRIFVEQNTLKVRFVYLPLNEKIFDTYIEFENELRSGVVKLVSDLFLDTNIRFEQFISDLNNGLLSLDDICNKYRGIGSTPVIYNNQDLNSDSKKQHIDTEVLKLVAMNAPYYFEIEIDNECSFIGKNKAMVDIVIPFNRMISRKHCKITRKNGIYYISDEGSLNGTYINGTRLLQGQIVPISKDNIITLADTDFQVV